MRIIRYAVIAMAFLAIGTVGAFAQTQPAGKVGLIDIDALGATGGATRYINALTALNKEFEAEAKALQDKDTEIQTKTAELQNLVQQAQKPGSPVSPETIRTRNFEIENLKRELKYKQEDLQARYGARQQKVVGPIFNELRVALREYALKNGYSMILDGAKLEEGGILMAFDTKYDVTKDFIAFFNARPAGTAPGN